MQWVNLLNKYFGKSSVKSIGDECIVMISSSESFVGLKTPSNQYTVFD